MAVLDAALMKCAGGGAAPPPCWELVGTFSRALAMASGTGGAGTPCCRRQEGQRIPLSWVMISLGPPAGGWPRQPGGGASLWLGQPPAQPVLVNTSQMPFSS